MARGRATVSVSSNIESVIDDVDDVKDDIPKEMRKRVGRAMRVLWADTKQYVLDDPHHSGNLFSAIKQEHNIGDETLEFSVYADLNIAPYAGIIEFGSGERTNDAWNMGNQVPARWPDEGSALPPDMPYESPGITPSMDSAQFRGFVGHIIDWMEEKGVQPQKETLFRSAVAIASTIAVRGNHAHPFLRPAWFDNKLKVRRAARHAVINAAR